MKYFIFIISYLKKWNFIILNYEIPSFTHDKIYNYYELNQDWKDEEDTEQWLDWEEDEENEEDTEEQKTPEPLF